jgi:hypothetical protein
MTECQCGVRANGFHRAAGKFLAGIQPLQFFNCRKDLGLGEAGGGVAEGAGDAAGRRKRFSDHDFKRGPKEIGPTEGAKGYWGSHEDEIVANLAAIMVAEKQHSEFEIRTVTSTSPLFEGAI